MSGAKTYRGEPAVEEPKASLAPTGMDRTGDEPPHDLKRKTARGALMSVVGQGASFFLRTGSMVVIARLVTPEQFGMVGMVTAVTGFLALFRDAGLSTATVQRASITHEQTSTLFWINVAVGGFLAALCVAMAPVLSAFYREPRLLAVTMAMGLGFLFYGVSAQHRALLQREMRFGVLALVEIVALVASAGAGIAMALAGMGYWALVGMATVLPAVSAVGTWAASGWTPGLPHRGCGVRSMLHYGGVLTLNGFVVYLVYNADKILLGRIWGAKELGIYGRAYQLINLPTESLNTVIGSVMFPALSRVQQDPARLRNYFLKGYGMFLALVIPITVACGLFATDIVLVLLGPQWTSAIPVFRLLTPTILAFALINPLAWLMQATGHATRSLKIAFFIAPVVVTGYVIGLPHGPEGVALGFSVAMMLLVAPIVHWAKLGTLVTWKDVLRTGMHPLFSIVLGAVAALAVNWLMRDVNQALLRLTTVVAVLFGTYGGVLLFGLGQKHVYLDLLQASGAWPKTRVQTL